MFVSIFERVAADLRELGRACTVEYPGYVSCCGYAFGTVDGYWAGNMEAPPHTPIKFGAPRAMPTYIGAQRIDAALKELGL